MEEWRAQSERLVGEGVRLRGELEGMRGELRAVERVLEGYLLVLGGRVRVLEDGRVVVKLINAGQGGGEGGEGGEGVGKGGEKGGGRRCVEFVLDAGKEEGQVEYQPKVIDMGGAAYPSELRGPMWFRTERTPNFTRYLLSLLYKKEEEGGESQGAEEQEEEGGQGRAKGRGESVEIVGQ